MPTVAHQVLVWDLPVQTASQFSRRKLTTSSLVKCCLCGCLTIPLAMAVVMMFFQLAVCRSNTSAPPVHPEQRNWMKTQRREAKK